jgi:hypothetical protein
MNAKPSPAQRRAIASCGEWGGIDATNAVFRKVVEMGWVEVDRRGRASRTAKGEQVVTPAEIAAEAAKRA